MNIFGPRERRKIDPIDSQQIYCLHTLQFNLALYTSNAIYTLTISLKFN